MMKIDSTAAKIGRSMKNLENMRASLLLLRRRFLLRFFLLLEFFLLLCDAHRRAGSDLHQALHDHALALLQSAGDDPVAARPFAEVDRARLGRALLVHDVDELALRSFEDGALRHYHRVGTHRAAQDHPHELARPDGPAGI